jgi:hypothetical protein
VAKLLVIALGIFKKTRERIKNRKG